MIGEWCLEVSALLTVLPALDELIQETHPARWGLVVISLGLGSLFLVMGLYLKGGLRWR